VTIQRQTEDPETWVSRSFTTVVIDSFTISTVSGRRVELVRNSVVREILAVLRDLGLFLESRGRAVDSSALAAQWQWLTLEDLTYEDIAAREGLGGDDMLDRAEALARRFRRFGME
jgi:hypothetical protein